jgi:hypothetical protein
LTGFCENGNEILASKKMGEISYLVKELIVLSRKTLLHQVIGWLVGWLVSWLVS